MYVRVYIKSVYIRIKIRVSSIHVQSLHTTVTISFLNFFLIIFFTFEYLLRILRIFVRKCVHKGVSLGVVALFLQKGVSLGFVALFVHKGVIFILLILRLY